MRPTNVSSKRLGSTVAPRACRTSVPFRGLSDQLAATTRTGRRPSGSRPSGGWKIAGSGAFVITTGSASAMPRRRCASRLKRDWHTVACASSAFIAAIRASVPSSYPRYVPIGPSTRWTRRTSSRTKRRSRARSKLNELKRHACVPPEIRFSSTVRPRCRSSPSSARRNWLPPPDGGGAWAWKIATSARPERAARRSRSVRMRAVTWPSAERAWTSAARGFVRSAIARVP